MVPDGALEKLPEPDDGGQAPAVQRVAVQLHRQQTRRCDGQLPGPERAAPRGRRRTDCTGAFQHPAGGAGTGRLRAGVQRHLVAQTQAGHRRQGRLLGPGSARRPGRDRHPAHESAHALLGAGRGGYPGIAELFLAADGEYQTAGDPLAPAQGPQRQCAGCAPVPPRRRAGHHRKERRGGLVLQNAGR